MIQSIVLAIIAIVAGVFSIASATATGIAYQKLVSGGDETQAGVVGILIVTLASFVVSIVSAFVA
ncbi:hypothetical protein EOS93_25130 [Rhizobium sp. RMa-01]|uniref:hypothetical protein n=1 Tax=unclassified Rhizobium TaxID=2613769 RepID=UPI0008DA897F|nr:MULTISPECIES: hypothetical protein [unclassified Rhizobium]OHV24954.1 hypothetical protein BBJ66_22705 [Rhizobium sp. RSm-3]RVU08339.1 hypothetical protein EOS93_25130 [Rhizobium sp. RMa-01]